MGLGSNDDKARKSIQQIAGKSDWKNQIRTPADAKTLIQKIKDSVRPDPNGIYFIEVYVGKNIRDLEDYIRFCKEHRERGYTFKEYLRQ